MRISLKLLLTLAWLIFVTSVKAQQIQLLPSNLILPEATYDIPFIWQVASANAQADPHGVMLIPVKLQNCPKQFYMQFDTGSPITMVYSSTISEIRRKYPKAILGEENSEKLSKLTFKTGKMPVIAKDIKMLNYAQTKINWADKETRIIIGTLGTDFFDGKVLTINYPGRTLTLSEEMSNKLSKKVNLISFVYTQRNILLPATLNAKKTMIYFDSGSSQYQLLTDQKTSEIMSTSNAKAIKNEVRSWDKILTSFTLPTADSISIGSTKIPLHFTTYINGASASKEAQMMKMGIGGLTGNKLFLNYILILDTQNKKFGLIKAD
jgi:hypothetical protein